MSKPVVHNASEIPFYQGDHEIPGIRFRMARKELGVSSWGMNLLEIEAHCDGHPLHDHTHDGQEEVYVVLSGSVDLVIGDERFALNPGDFIRVPPESKRQLVTGEQGVMILALGGIPGTLYEPTPGM